MEEEKEVLKLNPKFAVVERLDSENMEIETEMGLAKYRYQIIREDEIMDDLEDEVMEENKEIKVKKRRRLNEEEEKLMEEMEIIEAESRQIYDASTKTFDYTKKRSTDLKENSEVKLPQPSDTSTESSINVLKNRIMEVFRSYRAKECDSNGMQKTNMTSSEIKGLDSLKKRIKDGDLVTLKTDKSGNISS